MTVSALLYLTRRTATNRLARQAAQLRNPRYLLALLLGAGYLGYVLLRQQPSPRAGAGDPRWLELGGALMLAALVAWSWIVGVERRALAFSPAEVTFLFPAPITRRGLVHYKLVRTQVVVLLNTLLWTVLLRRGVSPLPPVLRALGLWTLLSTLSLHRLGASFVRTSLAEHGWAGLRRHAAPVALLALVTAGVVWTGVTLLRDVTAAGPSGALPMLGAAAAALARPVPAALLWPLRALVRPLGALTPAQWLTAIGPALLVLLVHYAWVVWSDTAFEEAAAAASLAEVRRRSAAGALPLTNRPVSAPLVPLAPRGWPAGAILWKNVTAVLRRRRARNLALAVAVAGGLAAAGSDRGSGSASELAAVVALVWLGFAFFFGPQWIRNDLRTDLPRADLLRALPVRGSAIVLAETLASTIALTLVELGLLGFAYLALLGNTEFDVSFSERNLALLGAFVVLPPVTFTAMLLQNGAALLFPAWVPLGAPRRGVEALGQNLLATAAFTLVLAVLLLAPCMLGLLVYELLERSAGPWAVGAGTVVGIAVLCVELAVVVRWLGRVFERTEPGAIPT
jgi:hypothetical protein